MQPRPDVDFVKEVFARNKSLPLARNFIIRTCIDDCVTWNGTGIAAIKRLFDILEICEDLVNKSHVCSQAQGITKLFCQSDSQGVQRRVGQFVSNEVYIYVPGNSGGLDDTALDFGLEIGVSKINVGQATVRIVKRRLQPRFPIRNCQLYLNF